MIARETAARFRSRTPRRGQGRRPGARRRQDGPPSVVQLLPQLREQVEGGLGDHGAGQEHRRGAHLQQRRDVVGRDHSPDHHHDVGPAVLRERGLQRGEQREVAGGQRGHPDDVHVGVDGLLGDLLGRREQRAHVDVEAHVGERADDDLLAAVVAVLAHLRDEDPRAAASASSKASVASTTCCTSRPPPPSAELPDSSLNTPRWYGSRPGAGRTPSRRVRESRRPSPSPGPRRPRARAGCRRASPGWARARRTS